MRRLRTWSQSWPFCRRLAGESEKSPAWNDRIQGIIERPLIMTQMQASIGTVAIENASQILLRTLAQTQGLGIMVCSRLPITTLGGRVSVLLQLGRRFVLLVLSQNGAQPHWYKSVSLFKMEE